MNNESDKKAKILGALCTNRRALLRYWSAMKYQGDESDSLCGAARKSRRGSP